MKHIQDVWRCTKLRPSFGALRTIKRPHHTHIDSLTPSGSLCRVNKTECDEGGIIPIVSLGTLTINHRCTREFSRPIGTAVVVLVECVQACVEQFLAIGELVVELCLNGRTIRR